MMPAANQGVGMNMGFPDVCTTPAAPAPIPIPYPNMGMNAMAMPFVPNVLVSMAPAQNMGSKPLLTNGDNAGVAHPLFMQPGGTTMGNPTILMGGMPASHLCNPTYGNNFNNPVGTKLVPSITNVMLSYTCSLSAAQRRLGALMIQRELGRVSHAQEGIVSVHLPVIGLRSDHWLERQLAGLRDRPVRAIALDLRANPGGVMDVAIRIASQLTAFGVDIAVAVDRGTASAAELLITLLNCTTFGERSFGKGRAATFDVFADDLVQRPELPTATFTGIDGTTVDGVGIDPDVATEPGTAFRDAQTWLRMQLDR